MSPELLIEMRVERPRAAPTGLRIWADGRRESLEPDARWRTNRRERWRLTWTYDEAERAELRRVIDEAGFPKLAPRYTPPGRVEDGGRVAWRTRLGAKVYRVEVESGARVPALNALLTALNQVKRRPQPSSTWKIGRGDEARTLEIQQDEGALPCFRALNGLIYSDPRATRPASATPVELGEAPRLAEAVYHQGEEETGRVAILPDGRVIADGALMHTLSPEGLTAVKAALTTLKPDCAP